MSLDLNPDVGLNSSYLSHILLKHTQLQALVEAELTVLPRPLHLVVSLQQHKDNVTPGHLSVSWRCVTCDHDTYLHDLVQNSHDAVRGSCEVGFGRRLLGFGCRATLENVQ